MRSPWLARTNSTSAASRRQLPPSLSGIARRRAACSAQRTHRRDPTLKSLIQDAIARANQETRVPLAPSPAAPVYRPAPSPSPSPTASPATQGGTSDDELASLLGGLSTKIKVLGC